MWEQVNITIIAPEDQDSPVARNYFDHPDVSVLADGLPVLGSIAAYPSENSGIGSWTDRPIWVYPLPLDSFYHGYPRVVIRVRKSAQTVKNKLILKTTINGPLPPDTRL